MIFIRMIEDRALGCHDGHSLSRGSNACVSWWSLVQWEIAHLVAVMVFRATGREHFAVTIVIILTTVLVHVLRNERGFVTTDTLTRVGEIICNFGVC